jgi:hypothetical protein
VVSALGSAGEAERGHSYVAWKGLKKLWEYHSEIADSVASGDSLQWPDESMCKHFNNLHRLFVRMEDEACDLTPALRDEIASLASVYRAK